MKVTCFQSWQHCSICFDHSNHTITTVKVNILLEGTMDNLWNSPLYFDLYTEKHLDQVLHYYIPMRTPFNRESPLYCNLSRTPLVAVNN